MRRMDGVSTKMTLASENKMTLASENVVWPAGSGDHTSRERLVVYLNTHLRFTGSVLNGLQNKKLCRIEGANSSV